MYAYLSFLVSLSATLSIQALETPIALSFEWNLEKLAMSLFFFHVRAKSVFGLSPDLFGDRFGSA